MTDRLDAMRAFVAVCDAGGFAAAARRLTMSPSVITRLVASLEEHLGVRLLQRTTRAVKQTDAGSRYLDRVRRILAEVEEADLAAQEDRLQPRGRLVVAAPMLFGRLHVAPLFSRYLATYPEIGGELQLADRLVNLVEDGIDVAFRIGELADSSLVARRFGQTRRILVATPSYLAAAGGPPSEPADLARHRLIDFSAMRHGRSWPLSALDGAPIEVAIEAHFTTNSGEAAIAHALADGGISAAFCYQVFGAIRNGTLVEVLREYHRPPVPIQAVFPTSRLLSSKVRAFLDLAATVSPGWESFLD